MDATVTFSLWQFAAFVAAGAVIIYVCAWADGYYTGKTER